MVEFTCTMILKNGWELYGASSTISLSKYTFCTSVVPKSDGIQENLTLSFIALAEHNAGTVKCVANNLNSHQWKYSGAALLMIQGTCNSVYALKRCVQKGYCLCKYNITMMCLQVNCLLLVI